MTKWWLVGTASIALVMLAWAPVHADELSGASVEEETEREGADVDSIAVEQGVDAVVTPVDAESEVEVLVDLVEEELEGLIELRELAEVEIGPIPGLERTEGDIFYVGRFVLGYRIDWAGLDASLAELGDALDVVELAAADASGETLAPLAVPSPAAAPLLAMMLMARRRRRA
jgi:hypothetical protein